jgi:hypothetical protein
MFVTLFSKSIPLTFILLFYVYTFFGMLIFIFKNYQFSLNPFSHCIDYQASIFCIVYLLIFYFLMMSLFQTCKLGKRYLLAGKSKSDKSPNETVL